MSPSRKLHVFSSTSRDDIKQTRGQNDALPLVRALPGGDDEPGLIELTTGGLRRVIKVNGFNIVFSEIELKQIGRVFEQIIHCLSQDLSVQLLAINKAIDAEKYMEQYLQLCQQEHAYLAWYADYTQKWFNRICDVAVVPHKSFYVVVAAEKRGPAAQADVAENLDRGVKEISAVLHKAGLCPEILPRSEIRKLLYSCLRPSYSSGLREAPAEILSQTSLPKAPVSAKKTHVVVDGIRVSNLVVSDLPSNACTGWLMDLVTMQFGSSISLHVRQADFRMLKSRTKSEELKRKIDIQLARPNSIPIEISCYISTHEDAPTDSEELINSQIEYSRNLLAKYNALVSPVCDQFSAWTSGLPLGIDSGGIAHCISSADASTFWPLFTGSCGSGSGFPLGFARASHEPVFLNPKQDSNVFVVASNQDDLKFLHALFMIRMLSANHHVFFLRDNKHGADFLLEALGPQSINENDLGANSEVEWNADAVLTLMRADRFNTESPRNYRNLISRWIQNYSGQARPLAIVLADVTQFGKTQSGIECLETILELAKHDGIYVLACGYTSKLKTMEELHKLACDYFQTQFVLPQSKKDRASITRLLAQPATKAIASLRAEEDNKWGLDCYLRTRENSGVVNLFPSPMDYWLCKSHTRERQARLLAMKTEIKEKNPKLSVADTARQAVYYLGLQSD